MSSYVVLARRWRPRSFAALVGQGHVTQALSHALASGRIPHAFLFSGIRGVGKTTLARLLAMCLNCEQAISAQPCGQCSSCKQIIAGNHPDVLEIDAASRTKVEQMREVLDMVGYSPALSRFRIFILDEVHMLSNQSFNALLKTLEEPPAHVKFLFATTEARKIPATILSRCQRYDLKRVSRDQLTAHLLHVLEQEGVAFERQGVEAVVRSAEGSVRDALSLLDQVIAHGAGEVRYAAVRDLLGLTEPEAILHLLEALLNGQAAGTLQLAQDFYANGVEPESLLRELLEALHQASRMKLALHSGEQNALAEGAQQRLYAITSRVSMEHLQMVYQVMLRGAADLRLAEDALQALEMLLLRVATLKPVPSLEKLLGLLEGHEPPPPGSAQISVSALPTASPPAPTTRESSVARTMPASTPAPTHFFSASTGEPKREAPALNLPVPSVHTTLPPAAASVETTAPETTPPEQSALLAERGELLHSWRQLVDYIRLVEVELAVKLERLVSCPHYLADAEGRPQQIVLQLASDVLGNAEQIRRLLVEFLRKQGMDGVLVRVEAHADPAARCETLQEKEQRQQQDHLQALSTQMQNHPTVQKVMAQFHAVLQHVRPLGSIASS
ncbi:DNA polymerase III subunit gamma/tau [Candidatus Magnetaquicoccus inordinatus]|uniref:DNA polymerase III subunit gamma/tau n=1 Tax=Candidatus Magnetaquicoccus inordinatus TaxID=2496818 RepID=UPI00102B9791|nr:DNA polymerase III subunit gamma/tau [Candidatus Magnetaquicoccus inordinatus]